MLGKTLQQFRLLIIANLRHCSVLTTYLKKVESDFILIIFFLRLGSVHGIICILVFCLLAFSRTVSLNFSDCYHMTSSFLSPLLVDGNSFRF